MLFRELKLLIAIRSLRTKSRDYLTAADRLEFAMKVQRQYALLFQTVEFPFSIDDVIAIYMAMRKNKNTRTKGDIAATHGTTCFWAGRGKGDCSDECEAGHLVPACRNGELSVANCIIECRAHNNQRREMTIEEYLISTKTTDSRTPSNEC